MKHKFLTILLSLITALCLCVGFVGCGGDKSGSTEQNGSEDDVHHHTFTVDNVCSGCGEAWEFTEGLEYQLCEGVEGFLDAHEVGYLVEAPDDTLSGDVVIPYGYNGKWVTTIGKDAFHGCEGITSVTIPESIVCIINGAFEKCTSLTSVVIPDSVVTVGSSIFEGCTSLESVKVGNGVEELEDDAFNGCTALAKIELPDNAMSIGDSVFKGTAYYNDPGNWDESGVLYIGNHLIKAKGMAEGTYTVRAGTKTIADGAFGNETYPEKEEYVYAMTGIVLPEGLRVIGDNAFYDCTALASITAPDSIIRIQDNFDKTAYYQDDSHWENGVLYVGNHLVEAAQDLVGEYSVRAGTKCIADDAFSSCKELTAIDLPDSVTAIGEYAFSSCSALESMTVPDGVKKLWDSAFYGCTALESIDLGSGLEAIDWSVFEGCKALKSLTIPASVTKLGYLIFSNCDALESLQVEAGNPVFRSEGNCILTAADNRVIFGCKASVIPNGVTVIGQSAFYECGGLKTIVIPDSVAEIAGDAFYGCETLENIVIPNGVTKIEGYTFGYCTSLQNVTIGSGVTFIEGQAFDGCDNLANVTFVDPNGWKITMYDRWTGTTTEQTPSAEELSDPALAATQLLASTDYTLSAVWTKG